MKLHMATLYTDLLELRALGTPTEGGNFEVEVLVDELAMKKSGSPKEFFFRELAIHLAQAMMDTSVPREFWWVRFTNTARIKFNLPEIANMEKG